MHAAAAAQQTAAANADISRTTTAAGASPAGAAVAFNRFFLTEHPKIVAIITGLVGSRSTAEDITQEAFIRTWKRWDTVHTYDKPGAFLRRVALNLTIDHSRRTNTFRQVWQQLTSRFNPTADQPNRADQPNTDDPLWQHVRQLPTRQQQAVALHYIDDMSVADCAQVMGCSPNTVKVHLHRARNTLADQLNTTAGATDD